MLLCLFECGEYEGDIFVVDTVDVRKINKAKETNVLLKMLCDYVADKMHRESEKEVIYTIDRLLVEQGFSVRKGDPNEGFAIRYYRTQGAYDFAFASDAGELVLELRIRNTQKRLDYLAECSESMNNTSCERRYFALFKACKVGK